MVIFKKSIMNKRIAHLLNHPFEVQLTDVALLQDEIDKYPYFSTLRSLLLFGLKEFDHPSYQEELKKTSIYSSSRVALYHYLQKERQESTEPTTLKSQEEAVTEIEPIAEIQTETIDISSKELSFTDWLKISSKQTPQEPAPRTHNERDIKFQLIDEFIEKAPRISPIKLQNPPVTSTQNEAPQEYSDLMTETLAQLYTQQKKYDKALRAYKILAMKYPEKGEYFTDKIHEIINMKDNRN